MEFHKFNDIIVTHFNVLKILYGRLEGIIRFNYRIILKFSNCNHQINPVNDNKAKRDTLYFVTPDNGRLYDLSCCKQEKVQQFYRMV